MGLTLTLQNFDTNGTYVNTTLLDRDIDVGYFYATPQITMLAPVKTITANWDQKTSDNLFKKDLVNQTVDWLT